MYFQLYILFGRKSYNAIFILIQGKSLIKYFKIPLTLFSDTIILQSSKFEETQIWRKRDLTLAKEFT